MPSVLITSGPTREKIDPVRFISNYSSGKQGHAIAQLFAENGFEVTLISGPVNIPSPPNVKTIFVETAQEMLNACITCLPVDVAICTAAVCDFRPENIALQKIKKQSSEALSIKLIQNPDILKTISTHVKRPKIVVGFAAETQHMISHAMEKLEKKGCDIILANNVDGGAVFGSDETDVTIITKEKVDPLGKLSKREVARELFSRIANLL